MTTQIKHFCDNCKKEVPDENNRFKVQYLVTSEDTFNRTGYQVNAWLKDQLAYRQDWCRECVTKWNLFNHVMEPKPNQCIVEPSFEDKLREIIRAEIDDARTS
jgi:hypothetical protein